MTEAAVSTKRGGKKRATWTQASVCAGMITQQEIRSIRAIHEMTLNLWDRVQVLMDDVDRRVKLGARVEPGPESVNAIWDRARELAEEVLSRNATDNSGGITSKA